MTNLIIDPEQVNKAFLNSLYTDLEVKDLKGGSPEGTIIVEGIRHRYGFHPIRLKEKCDRVRTWLAALPSEFHREANGGGGGWSFLNACNQENGVQWTGLHIRMEQLFCLGMGLGFAKSQLPREVWHALPGGMPYYVIDLNHQTDD